MKKFTILFAFILLPVWCFAQEDAISKFYGKYADDASFTTVFISKRMFSMFASMADEDDKELKESIRNIGGLRILSTDSHNGHKLYKEAGSMIPLSEYEELMVIREGKDQTKFLIKENAKKQITELLMISGNEESFTIMSFVGIINLEQISKMSSSMEIEGLEHLEEFEKKKNDDPDKG